MHRRADVAESHVSRHGCQVVCRAGKLRFRFWISSSCFWHFFFGLHIESSCTFWHHSAFHVHSTPPQEPSEESLEHVICELNGLYATPLPVQSEMLFAHWSAAFGSPQQHELASYAERFTLVRDQSVIALLVGRLRGTYTVPPSMQMYWVTESMLFSSCLSVDPSTEDSGTPM